MVAALFNLCDDENLNDGYVDDVGMLLLLHDEINSATKISTSSIFGVFDIPIKVFDLIEIGINSKSIFYSY